MFWVWLKEMTTSAETLPTASMDDLSASSTSSVTAGYMHIQKGSKRMPKVFDFHSGRKCPTCAGTGKIPKGQEDELVALIPYSDKRLKPKKPWVPILIVVLAIFILVLVASIVLAVLMYPREVTVSKINATELHSFIHYKHDQVNVSNVTLELSTSVTIDNKNYFPLHINYITMELEYFNVIVSNQTQTNLSSVSSSTFKTYTFKQNATFQDSKGKRLLLLCASKTYKSEIHLDISVSVSYTYLSHTTSTIDSFSHYLDCQIKIPIHNMTLPTIQHTDNKNLI